MQYYNILLYFFFLVSILIVFCAYLLFKIQYLKIQLKISHEEVSELKENLKEAQMNVNNLLIDLQKIKSEVNNNENEISRLNVKLNEAKTEVIKHENMLLNVLHTSTLALLTGASNFSENDVRRTYSYTGERRVTENLDKV